jgi:hypothetical protein
MIKNLYVSAACRALLTLLSLVWLSRLTRPIHPPLSWFFELVDVVGLVLGMNLHSPSYGYLVPITFCLFFLFCLAVLLLVSQLRKVAS